MSTNVVVACISFEEFESKEILINLSSGTLTTPTFGSIVQNGKFSAGIDALVIALNSVDFPTLGRPTIPHLNPTFNQC